MSARDVIAKHLCTMAAQGWSGISAFERAAYRTTAIRMVDALTASGYRILGPDEIDAVTVDVVARVIGVLAEHMKSADRFLKPEGVEELASAVRALCATHQGDK